MASMLLERLSGIDFNGTKYICDRNVPDPSSGAYHYVPYGRSEARPAARTRHIVKPKIMAPPVLRMPTFTAPAPFCPSEAGKPEVAPAQEIEKPAPPKEEKKEKGILAKIKKLF